MGNLEAGWYDDGSGQQRWWDGQAWTEHVQQPRADSALAGRYTLKSELGRGSFGTVYLARDARSGNDVAVKMFTVVNADARASVQREAAALIAVRSDNCLQVIEVIDTPDALALVTDYVPGATLRELLDIHGALSGPEAAQVLWGAATGLGAVHAAGLVHGDVKPANILVSPTGLSKLIDFGLVGLPGIRSADGSVSGSPAYSAPEQMLNGVRDARSDIYALSVTLFEVLCQQRPFTARTHDELVRAHAYAPIPDPRQYAPGLSPELAELVMNGLAKNPADRPASVQEFLRRFEAGARETWGPQWMAAGSLAAIAAGVIGGNVTTAGTTAAPIVATSVAKGGFVAATVGTKVAVVAAATATIAAVGVGGYVAYNHFSSTAKTTSVAATPAIEGVLLADSHYTLPPSGSTTSASYYSATGTVILNDGRSIPLRIPTRPPVPMAGTGRPISLMASRYSPNGRWFVVNTTDSPWGVQSPKTSMTVLSTTDPQDQFTISCDCRGVSFDAQGHLVTLDASSASFDSYAIASAGLTKASSQPIGGSANGFEMFLKPYLDANRSASSGIANPPVTMASMLEFAPPMLVGRSGDSALISFGTPCDGPFGAPSLVEMDLSSGALRSLKQHGSKYPPFVCTNELVGASPDGSTVLLDSESQCGHFAMTVDLYATLADPDGYWHGGQVPYDCDNSMPKDASGNPAMADSLPVLDGSQIRVHFPSGWYAHSWVTGTGQFGSADPYTPWQAGSNPWTSRTHDGKTLAYAANGVPTLNGRTVATSPGVLWVAPAIHDDLGTTPAALSPSPTPSASTTPSTDNAGYETYRNVRFGFTVQVPTSFVAGTPPQNGDGLTWKSADGTAILGAFASNNVSGDTAAKQLQSCKESVLGGGGRVTYSFSDSKVWACSGYAADGSIFYDWGRVETNVEYGMTWNYPVASKSTYGPMVTRTVNSFHAGPDRSA